MRKLIKSTLAMFFICKLSSSDIVIDWPMVKNATKYEVNYVVDNGFSMTQTVLNSNYLIKDATIGAKYIITIRALDDSTNQSATSIPLFIQVPTPTNPPVFLKQPEPKFRIIE